MNDTRFLRTSDPDLGRAVSVGLQKGGTGKSTLVASVGHEAARLGARVLLIDFDPNWHLTRTFLGYNPVPLYDPETGEEPESDLTVADLLTNCTDGGARDAVLMAPRRWAPRTDLDWESGGVLDEGGALTFIPGYPALQGIVDNRNVPAAELRLRRSLKGVANQFDLVLIDTGPRADASVQTAMLAAATAISPVQPEPGAVEGLDEQLEFLEGFAHAWGHDLRFAGAVCAQYDSRNKKAHTLHLNELRDKFLARDTTDVTHVLKFDGTEPEQFCGVSGGLWDEVIPRSTMVVNTQSNHDPLSTLLEGSPTSFPERKARDRARAFVALHTRIALRLMQLTEAPRLPQIAQALQRSPIPGVWPAGDNIGADGVLAGEPAQE